MASAWLGKSMEPRSRPNGADTAIRLRIRVLARLAAALLHSEKGRRFKQLIHRAVPPGK